LDAFLDVHAIEQTDRRTNHKTYDVVTRKLFTRFVETIIASMITAVKLFSRRHHNRSRPTPTNSRKKMQRGVLGYVCR